MSYTKARAIEQIWFNVTGGNADPQSDVLKADIESYLPAAINAAIGENLTQRKLMSLRERKPNNYKFSDLLLTQDYTPQYDETRKARKIELGYMLPSYSGEMPLVVLPSEGGNSFPIFPSRGDLQGIEEVMAATSYVWIERRTTGDVLFFGNFTCDNCSVTVQAACDYDSLSDESMMPIPDDLWAKIFAICEEYFTKQRATPSDELVDAKDTIK